MGLEADALLVSSLEPALELFANHTVERLEVLIKVIHMHQMITDPSIVLCHAKLALDECLVCLKLSLEE